MAQISHTGTGTVTATATATATATGLYLLQVEISDTGWLFPPGQSLLPPHHQPLVLQVGVPLSGPVVCSVKCVVCSV